MTATNPKLLALMEALVTATEKGKLTWIARSVPDSFATPFQQNSEFIIDEQLDDQESDCEYFVLIRNSAKQTIESEIFRDDSPNYEKGGDPHFVLAKRLFCTARRAALEADSTLDQMIADVTAKIA